MIRKFTPSHHRIIEVTPKIPYLDKNNTCRHLPKAGINVRINTMEEQRLMLPYGIADFASLRKQGYLYVDRSNYIETLERKAQKFSMFLRPRRFGKSLFLSLLNYYYGSIYENQFDELFQGLYIHENPTPFKNSYAILKFDFSGIKTDCHENSVFGFSSSVRTRILVFLQLYFPDLNLNEKLPPIEHGAENILDYALNAIQASRSTQKVYVLIDEYDHFANEILSFRYQEYLKSVAENGFIRKFYEKLKFFTGEGVVDRIFITGVSPITLDSLTSGFNISMNITLDEDFHAMVGFTEQETQNLIARSFPSEEIDKVMDDCKIWYDGYRFCEEVEERLFNPNMLLYFLNHIEKRGRYPKNMLDENICSDYRKISQIFDIQDKAKNLEILEELIKNRKLNATLIRRYSLQKHFEPNDFVSLLFYMGVLTINGAIDDDVEFVMPNLVLEHLYLEFFINHLADENNVKLDDSELKKSLREMSRKGNPEKLIRLTEKILHDLSHRDAINMDEKHVKAIICSFISLIKPYIVKSEYELPEGYIDLLLLKYPAYQEVKYQFLFEFKYCKKNSSAGVVKDLIAEGKEQLQKYCCSPEIADKIKDKDCPLKPYLLVFKGTQCCHYELFEP